MSLVYRKRPRNTKHKNHGFKKKFDEIIKKYENHDSESDESSNSSDDDDFHHDNKNHDVSCKDNKIYFKAYVTDDTISTLIKIIEAKNRKFKKFSSNKLVERAEPKPLYLHITSHGGSLLACFRAIDAIKRSHIPIYTVVDGYAASAGTLMSVVGKKRYMTPSSYMLIHQLQSGSIGKYWEMKDDNENIDQWMKDIYNIYVTHSKIQERELKEYLSHDLWWKSDKCLEMGLIDAIYENDVVE